MSLDSTCHWKRNLVLLLISQILVLAGFTAAMPFIPLFLRDHMKIASEVDRGLYMSMFTFFGTFGYALFCPIWGSLSDKYGVKIMLLRGTFVTAFLFPLMGYCSQPWMLITLRFLTAACAGTTAASHILIAKNTPEDKQGFAQGVLSTSVFCGSMLGNVLGGFIVHYFGYLFTFWTCGITYLIAGLFVLFVKENFQRPLPVSETAYVKKIRSYRKSPLPAFTIGVWLMLMLFGLWGCISYMSVPYIAMMVELISDPKEAAYWTGIICAFASGGALVSGVVLGYLADKLPPKILMIPVLSIAGILLILQGFSPNLWVYGITRTLMTVFTGGLSPILFKILSGATPMRKRGAVFGWSSTFSNGGVMLSTVFAGWIIFVWNTRGIHIVSGAAMILMIPVVLWILHRIMNQPFFLAHSADLFKKKK